MSQRSSQVSEELRKVISMILIQDLTEPSLGFVTITRVEVTDDLRFARVFYSVMGTEEQCAESERVILKNRKFIRKLAVEKINMRYAMEIRLERDHSIEHSIRIGEILKKIKKKEEL